MPPDGSTPRIGMTITKRMLGAAVASVDAVVMGAVLVPRIGFEPMISALRGRCPGPLDERGAGRADPRGCTAEERQKYKPASRACRNSRSAATMRRRGHPPLRHP